MVSASYHLLSSSFQGSLSPEPVDLGGLKRQLSTLGVNSRGWRLFLDFGDALFLPLIEGRPGLLNNLPALSRYVAEYLCLLQACEMDVLPPAELVRSMARWAIPFDSLRLVPPLFFRATWKAAISASYALRSLDAFIDQELVPICAWFFSSGQHASGNSNRLKAGWPSLVEDYEEWQHQAAQPRGVDEWHPIVRRVAAGGFCFVALTSEPALAEEGTAMRHCVGGYANSCRSGRLRIFSVREERSHARVATLSVRVGLAHWEVDQLKGPGNADVSDLVCQSVYGLLASLADAERLLPEVRAAVVEMQMAAFLVARDFPDDLLDDLCF